MSSIFPCNTVTAPLRLIRPAMLYVPVVGAWSCMHGKWHYQPDHDQNTPFQHNFIFRHMTRLLFSQALRYSGIVGAVTLEALKGTNPVWALPIPLVLGCLDAWVRLGLLHETREPNQASLESAHSPQLTVSVVTRIFTLAVKAMQSEDPGKLATLVSHCLSSLPVIFLYAACTLLSEGPTHVREGME